MPKEPPTRLSFSLRVVMHFLSALGLLIMGWYLMMAGHWLFHMLAALR
jgi:hypothetical protein